MSNNIQENFMEPPLQESPYYVFYEHLLNGGTVHRADRTNDIIEDITIETLGGNAASIRLYGYRDLSIITIVPDKDSLTGDEPIEPLLDQHLNNLNAILDDNTKAFEEVYPWQRDRGFLGCLPQKFRIDEYVRLIATKVHDTYLSPWIGRDFIVKGAQRSVGNDRLVTYSIRPASKLWVTKVPEAWLESVPQKCVPPMDKRNLRYHWIQFLDHAPEIYIWSNGLNSWANHPWYYKNDRSPVHGGWRYIGPAIPPTESES